MPGCQIIRDPVERQQEDAVFGVFPARRQRRGRKQPLRVGARELQGDDPAERIADDVRPLDLEVIDEQGRTIDKLALQKTDGVQDESYAGSAVSMEHVTIHQHVVRSFARSRQIRPEKDQPVQAKFRLSPAPSGEGFKVTLSLVCDKKYYQLPGKKTVNIPDGDAFREVAITAVPIAGAEVPADQHPATGG